MFLALGLIAQYVVPQYGIPIALTVAVIGFFIIRNADKREYIEKGGQILELYRVRLVVWNNIVQVLRNT